MQTERFLSGGTQKLATKADSGALSAQLTLAGKGSGCSPSEYESMEPASHLNTAGE